MLAKGGGLRLDLGSARGGKPPASVARPPAPAPGGAHSLADLRDLERALLLERLESKNWKIYGPRGAAESLGIPPTTLVSKMKRLGIRKPP